LAVTELVVAVSFRERRVSRRRDAFTSAGKLVRLNMWA